MTRFRKTVLVPGPYQSPDGTLVATPERIKRWIEQFREMRRLGLQFPLPWGHQPRARPATENEVAEQEYWRSRFNAGYLDDFEVGPNGEMILVGVSPHLEVDPDTECLIDRETRGAIKEVSIAVGNFRDGQNRLWEDVPLHVALTPHPVYSGQDGFKQEDEVICLSLRQLAIETPMPDDPKPKEEKKETKSSDAGGGQLKELLDKLKGHKITLPDDTSMDNFIERMIVALTALDGEKGDLELPEPPKEEKESMDVPATPEAPMMLSLSDRAAQDPLVAGLVAKMERDSRKIRLERIDKLVRRGLSAATAARLRQQAGEIRLSLTAQGDEVETEVDRLLSTLESELPDEDYLEARSGSRVESPPEGTNGEHSSRVADDFARVVLGRRANNG